MWGLVARQYFWPALRGRSRADAVRPILFLHAFRFMGLSFLIPGVVSPDLPASFARQVAYGDLATAVLALLALAMLDSKLSDATIWLFNIVGAVDLLNAYYQGNRVSLVNAPGLQGRVFHSDAGGAASAGDARSRVPHHAAASDPSCFTRAASCGMSRLSGFPRRARLGGCSNWNDPQVPYTT